jgi:hypothetical protein
MNKIPELTAGLIAVKGRAAPPSPIDMPQRTTFAPTQAIALPQLERAGVGALQPLNFRISADFRRSFKTYAARHDLKLNELLVRSFEAYRAQQGD